MHGLHSPPITSIKWSGTYGQLIFAPYHTLFGGCAFRDTCLSRIPLVGVLLFLLTFCSKTSRFLTQESQISRPPLHPVLHEFRATHWGACQTSSVQTWEACGRGAMVLLIAWQVCKHPASFSAPRAPKAPVSSARASFSDVVAAAGDFLREPAVQAAYYSVTGMLGNLQKVTDFVNSFNTAGKAWESWTGSVRTRCKTRSRGLSRNCPKKCRKTPPNPKKKKHWSL